MTRKHLGHSDISTLLLPEVQAYIRTHEKDDPADLALQNPPPAGLSAPLILDQIKARQKAQRKVPGWLAPDKIILFPGSALVEQASSLPTALYKASLTDGKHFTDLTAGLGVDSYAFSQKYSSGTCIEKDSQSASFLSYNLPLLTKTPLRVVCADAADYCARMGQTDFVYMDPARRTSNVKGRYRLEEGQPNIFELLPFVEKHTRILMVKTSPILDIDEAIRLLPNVRCVHVLELNGECKEVLYICDFTNPPSSDDVACTAVSLDESGQAMAHLSFNKSEEKNIIAPIAMPGKYLYEPGPAFMKAGAYASIAKVFDVKKLHKHTHLYTSDTKRNDFPGRAFTVVGCYPVKEGSLPLKKANIAVRNFPASVRQLYKKLKLQEGGQDYVFAVTLADERKALLHVNKA